MSEIKDRGSTLSAPEFGAAYTVEVMMLLRWCHRLPVEVLWEPKRTVKPEGLEESSDGNGKTVDEIAHAAVFFCAQNWADMKS
jgi:hypothetical protein